VLSNIYVSAFALGLALLATAPDVQAAPIAADVGPSVVLRDRFPVQPAHYPGNILAIPDVEFANYVGFRPLQLDLYVHKNTGTAQPLVIWLHGCNWDHCDSRLSGAFTNFPAVLAAIAARGYVVASVNYRLSHEAPFPAAIQDVKAAIRFLRTQAKQYGIDPSRVYIWGGSAGGQLAALAATSCGVPEFAPPASTARLPRSKIANAAPPAVSDCVQGAVIWYGVFDLTASLTSGSDRVAVQTFLGCPADCVSAAAKASPITYLSPATPPMLIMCGTDDDLLGQSKTMAARMRAMSLKVDELYLPDTDHVWVAKKPERTRSSSLEALQATVEYLDRISKRPANPAN
jgi:acetyl esterase/lipase